MSVLPAPGQEQFVLPADGLSEATRQLVEVEARRIVDECYTRAIDELSANRHRLDRLAAALLEHETLDEADAYRVAGVRRDDARPRQLKEAVSAGSATADAGAPALVGDVDA
jgi:cell division protease FtsH